MKLIEKQNIHAVADDLIRHGYAERQPHEITVEFELTQAEFAPSEGHYDLYRTTCNEQMGLIMDAISSKVCCHPSEKEETLFLEHGGSENMDQSHTSEMKPFPFKFIVNPRLSPERHKSVADTVLDILEQQDTDTMCVTVLYIVRLDKEKIRKDAEAIAPTLIGKRVQYQPSLNSLFGINSPPVEGRIVEYNGNYFFMKLRARTRGHRLSDEDILRIFWDLQAGK